MPRKEQPQETAQRFYNATTLKEKDAALAAAVAQAREAKTKEGAAVVARLLPFPPVIAAAVFEWERRAQELADFREWLVGVDTWLANLSPGQRKKIPVSLWPSRMGRAAEVWSEGPKGTPPDKLKGRFVAAQAKVLPTA